MIQSLICENMPERMDFSLVSTIRTEDPATWSGKIFLTFDVDWAHDEVIEDTLSLCQHSNVPITLFATHYSGVLAEWQRRQASIELGLHPNFNPLLDGSNSSANYRARCFELKELYPAATSVRSHSLCFGSLIQTVYEEIGVTHDSSVIVPYQWNNESLFPWKMWDGLVRVPYFFCDYITAMTKGSPIAELVSRQGLKVFDFHPIHVFLNTENLDRYERTRSLHQNPKELIKHRYSGYGTRNRLIELLRLFD